MSRPDDTPRDPPAPGPASADRPALTEAGLAAKAAREARSAAALRENLRRRKAQARARTGVPATGREEDQGGG